MTEGEAASIRQRLSDQLKDGSFHYVLAAQRFTPSVENTIDYLNAAMPGARFYAVEIVGFAGDSLAAFESRTVIKPRRGPGERPPATATNEAEFFQSVSEEAYREALHELFEVCRGLGLRFEWGSIGVSIRLPTGDRPEPLTVAWAFPPGRAGWMSLTDLTLGYDSSSADKHPSAQSALQAYLASVQELGGIEEVETNYLRGTAYRVSPAILVRHRVDIAEILATLVRSVNDGTISSN